MTKFRYVLATRWGDMDALNHVNHTKYLTYFEQARVAWWQSINIDLHGGAGPVLVKVEAEYLRSLSAPSEVVIELYAHSASRSSYWINYQLFHSDELCALGKTKLVWVDYKKNSSVPLPTDMLKHINKSERES